MLKKIRDRKIKNDMERLADAGNEAAAQSELSTELARNIELLDSLFADVDIMISHRFANACRPELAFCVLYSDGVADSRTIHENIMEPLLHADRLRSGARLMEQVREHLILVGEVKVVTQIREIVEAVTYGDTLLLAEGCNQALILGSKNFTLRSVQEPEGEKVLSGPREGFNESIMTNLSLIRRRLRTSHLKIKFRSLGRQTATAVCVCYLDNIVNRGILREIMRRLDQIDIDSILDSQYITEYIAETSLMGFTTAGYTERPDVVVSKLLEGRVAILVDGTPMVLTAPYLFIENFQSNEDYYTNSFYATFSRILRMVGFFLTIITPSLFVAIVAFHQEILPPEILMSISGERQTVPATAGVEAFVMLLVFDILKETGVRMPTYVGQALSIVGALVIGQAAVEANLVASPMIIVVAFTGITGLLVPKMSAASLIGRYFTLLLTSCFGLTGMIVALSILLIHVLNLQSFGVPCLMPLQRLSYQEVKDTFIRAPWPSMLTRITPLSGNRMRATPVKRRGLYAKR